MSAPSMTTTMTNNKVQNQALLSSSMIEEETNMKQGIITILDSINNTSYAPPLRRTLSADMSSKNWLNNNIASSQEENMHSNSFSSTNHEVVEAEDEAERERLEIWSSIQRNKKAEQEKAGQFDTWSSIISLKGNDEISKSLPVTPYVHPLVKRTKSSLSEKSLEICTESLGSETGSDGLLFCSYPSSSETGETEEEEEQEEKLTQQQQQQQQQQELHVPKNNYAASLAAKKASPPRAFPPPLPSLSHQQTIPSLHMRSHRDNGRLVLQAVSVPSLNNFSVQREEGRLVLTFANRKEEEDEENHDNDDDDNSVEEVEELEGECFGGFEFEGEDDCVEGKEEYEGEEEEEEEEEGDVRDVESGVIEKVPLLSSEITSSSVHRLALMMNKPIELVNRNPKWSEKFNAITNFEDVNVVEVETSQATKSLSPRVPRLIPSTQAVASFNFNAYEYYWRTATKPTSTKPPSVSVNQLDKDHQHNNDLPLKSNSDTNKVVVSRNMNKVVSNEQQQLLVLRGKNGDYLVHNWKSCKDSRRSFLFWEPYCIATS